MAGFLRVWAPVIGCLATGLSGSASAQEKDDAPGEVIIRVAQEPKTPEPKKTEPKKETPDPKTPKVDLNLNQPPTDVLGGDQTASRTSGSSSFAPNMFGDAFGGKQTRITALLGHASARSFVLDPSLQNLAGTGVSGPLCKNYGPGAFGGIAVFGNSSLTNSGPPIVIFPNGSPQYNSIDSANNIGLQISNSSARGANPVIFSIIDNAEYRAAADAAFKKLYGAGGYTVFSQAGSRVIYQPINPNETGTPFPPGSAQIFYEYDRFADFTLPSPGSGGVVGRTKIAEDNNPLPRDRFIFNYDFFANTPLNGGYDVHRFSPGIEMTFLDQMASFEVRLPFASTLSPESTMGSAIGSRDAVLGNLYVTLKYLAYSEQMWHVATGVAASIPTAPDEVVKTSAGTEFLRVKNETLNFVPYVATIYTPTAEFFWQNWFSLTMDATGSPVLANLDGTGPRSLGRIRDQAVLAIDTQIGYWLITPGSGTGFLQGLAPFLELHYNSSISNAGQVTSGNFRFAASDNRYDELNMSTGFAAYLDRNLLVSTTLSLPLKNNGDRFFDYQLGFRMSYFFGATAANRQNLQFGR